MAYVGGVFDTVNVDWVAAPPIVNISSPLNGSEFESNSNVVVTGRAIAGDHFSEIVSATIDGAAVAALDSAGNFFAIVSVALETNAYQVVATDSNGIETSVQLELIGVATTGSDVDSFVSIRAGHGVFEYFNTTFNRELSQVLIDVSLTNLGPDTIPRESLAVFDPFFPVAVDLLSSDGVLDEDRDYFVMDDEFSPAGLEFGQSTPSWHLVLQNPNRDRFRFRTDVLRPLNLPPRFTSIPQTVVAANSSFLYLGTASDPENARLKYSLLVAPPGMSIDESTGRVDWTPATNDVGTHDVQLAVSDGSGSQVLQAFALLVTSPAPTNRPPLISSSPITALNIYGASGGADYVYQVLAIDPESGTLSFSLLDAPSGMTISSTGLITWNATSSDLGSPLVGVQVIDNGGAAANQYFQLAVVNVLPAQIAGTAFDDTNLNGLFDAGESGLPAQLIYMDRNGNGLLDFGEISSTTNSSGHYMFEELLPGTYSIVWLGRTGLESSSTSSQQVSVGLGETRSNINFALANTGQTNNLGPSILSLPPTSARVGTSYEYQLQVTDPDGDSLSFSLLNAPAGMTIDPEGGLVSWTPTAEQQSVHAILVQADDGNGNTDLQSYTIFVRPQFQSPSIESTPSFIATAGREYRYNVVARDPDQQIMGFSFFEAPAGMTIDSLSGEVRWTPSTIDLGTHSVRIVATDESSLKAIQTYALTVRKANVAPVFLTEPILQAVADVSYRYEAFAADPDDAVTYSLMTAPLGMTIDTRTGQLLWKPGVAEIGLHDVTVRATDERGLTAEQFFTVSVVPDTNGPSVSIVMSGTVLEPGQSITIQVLARDNVAVSSVELLVDGSPLALDANQTAIFVAGNPGLFSVVAQAIDVNANVGGDVRSLRVIDPTDDVAPIVEITSPTIDGQLTFLSEVTGTVSAADLEYYQLQYSLSGLNNWITFAQGTSEVFDDVLGTFDPTMLANDIYDMRLLAQDFSGNIGVTQIFVSVEGQAKLGNFRLEFNDLTIPLGGVPITINRVYDTLDASFNQDFGYGWHLALGTARIRETVRLTAAEQSGVPSLFGGNPFRSGTRVYLNTPGGKRVGFTFSPQAEPGFFGTVWRPKFVSDPGVYEQLEVNDVALSQNPDGTFGTYLTGFAFNPRTYTLITKDQRRYKYDQFNELLSVSDRNGVTLEYRDDGIFSSTGQSIQWLWDDQGRITKIVDPNGNSIIYDYNGAGNLVSVTDQVGNVTQMNYHSDRAHYLSEIFGPRGNLLSRTEYDDAGRVAAVIDADGNPITRVYDLANNTEVIGDRLGNETTLVFDDRGNITEEIDPLGNSTVRVYDANDNEIEVTDARGFTTLLSYDDRGNVTSVTDPIGGVVTTTYSPLNDVTSITDQLGRTALAVYDAAGNLAEIINAVGNTQQFAYDLQGRAITLLDFDGSTTAYEYGRGQFPTQVTNPDGTTQTTQFNLLGLPIKIVDENGNETTFNQNAAGQATSTIDAAGGVTTFGYAGELLTTVTDALGRTTTFEYNDSNRLIRTAAPLGGVTEMVYDANGDVLQEIDALGRIRTYAYRADRRLQSITDALGGVASFAYDSAGNRTAVSDANGNVTSFDFDELNRLIRQTDSSGGTLTFEYDLVGNLVKRFDQLGQATSFSYDDLDRLTTTTDPLGGVVSRTHDEEGNVVAETDEIGRTTTFTYDSRNRRVSSTDARGQVTQIVYDGVGNQVSVTDPLGNLTQFVYDKLDRVTQRIDPLGNSALLTYDAVGNLTQTIDRNGLAIDFAYDELDRPTTEIWRDGSTTVNTISSSYDSVGNLLSVADEYSSYAFTYDNLNRVVSEDNSGTFATADVALSYTFDAAGNLTSIVDNSGVAVGSTYDARDLLISRTWQGPGVDSARIDFGYDARWNRTSIDRFADLAGTQRIGRSEFDYDISRRLTGAIHFDGLDATVADYGYTYDLANQLLQQTLNGDTSSFTYDNSGQLTEAVFSAQTNEDFSYDGNGNRNAGTIVGPNNQILSDGTFDFTYDAEGNLISRIEIATGDAAEYIFDHRNRMIRFERRDSSGIVLSEADYVYDVFDRRIAKVVDADGEGPQSPETTYTAYDGEHAWADLDVGGNVLARYLFGNRTDEIIARYRAGEGTAWYLADRLGTVRDIVDASGASIDHIDYDSFGKVVSETNFAAGDRFKFTGREFDVESGLYFYRARHYDAGLGRFISQDPLGFDAGDANLYRYVGNAPTNATDPFGLVAMVERATVQTKQATRNTAKATVACLASEAFFTVAFAAAGIPPDPTDAVGVLQCFVAPGAAAIDDAAKLAKNARKALSNDVGNVVIGKMDDIRRANGWKPGETLLALNNNSTWLDNKRLLKKAIDQGRPIRDLNPFNNTGFLGREHQHLREAGWNLKKIGDDFYWVSP